MCWKTTEFWEKPWDLTPIIWFFPVRSTRTLSGWRGTAGAIAAKTVRAMESTFGCRAENIRAAIGPNIGPCHFETNADVPQAMLEAFGTEARDYIEKTGEKYHVDLKGLIAMILRNAGVSHIEVSDACTACRQDLFWSHRLVGQQRGSEGAVIVCGEGCK